MKIELGYAGINTVLRKKHVFMSRTCRSITLRNSSVELALEMMQDNMQDLLKILKWNVKHGIKLFRMSSAFAPHITNPEFITDKHNYKSLAYNPAKCRNILREIGKYARDNKLRLTFHPDPFIVLGTNNPDVLIKSKRELYFHAKILDMMGLDYESVIVIHGGGIYGDKPAAMARWIKAFNELPIKIKSRIVIENDEYVFNIADMLKLSRSVNYYGFDKKYKIPVVFDMFHYECYNLVNGVESQPDVVDFLPKVLASWKYRTMKMHISNQKPDAQLGAHSDYITKIPKFIYKLNVILPGVTRVDIMVEAKMKEQAVLKLRKKIV